MENGCTNAPERSLKPHRVSSWIQQHNEKLAIRLEFLLLAIYFCTLLIYYFFLNRGTTGMLFGGQHLLFMVISH